MSFGALFMIVGGGLTLLGYAVAQPGHSFLIFNGAIIIGAIQFIIGLVIFLKSPRTPRPTDPFRNASPDFRALLRAMVAAAEYQSRLDDRKISLIASILRRVHGKDYDPTTVSNGCRALSGEGETLIGYLVDVQSQLSLEFRRTIVRASGIVLGAGRALAEEQKEFLLYMSRALQLPDEEFAANLANLGHIAP
jgi:hypothetical protein